MLVDTIEIIFEKEIYHWMLLDMNYFTISLVALSFFLGNLWKQSTDCVFRQIGGDFGATQIHNILSRIYLWFCFTTAV